MKTEPIEDEAPAIGQKQLSPSSLQNAEHYCTRWMAVVGEEATPNDIARPDFWVHVASKLRRMDWIIVSPESEGWIAELLVRSTGIGYVKVQVLRIIDLEDDVTEERDLSSFVKWGGVADKFRVIRKSDKTVLSSGHQNKATAMQWQAKHEKAIA